MSIHSTAGLDRNGSKAKETVNGDPYDLDLFTGKANGQDLSLNQVPCAFRSIVFATRKDFSHEMTELVQVFQNNLAFPPPPTQPKTEGFWNSALETQAGGGKFFPKERKLIPLPAHLLWQCLRERIWTGRSCGISRLKLRFENSSYQGTRTGIANPVCKNERLSSKPPLRLTIRPFPRRPHQGAVLFCQSRLRWSQRGRMG